MRFCHPLGHRPLPATARVGGKALNLARLARIPQVRIPPGTAIDARAFEAFLQSQFTARAWTALVADFLRGQRGPLLAEVAHSPLPDALLAEVMASLPPGGLVIVRSSGIAEDAATTSLAGHYESVMAEADARGVAFALKSCWLVGVRVFLDLLAPADVLERPALAARAVARSLGLVVQSVVPARSSGVYFSRAPMHAGRAQVVANWGTCHGVVDGTLAADSYLLRRGRLAGAEPRFKFEMTMVDHQRLAPAPGQTVETPCGPTAVHVPRGRYLYTARVPPPLDGSPVLDQDALAQVHAVGSRLRRELGWPVDMEWSFDADGLVVLQARPITTGPPPRRPPAAGRYAVASPGIATGPVRNVSSPQEVSRVHQGDVVAVAATDPDYMPILYRAAALLSEEGSPLCHTAIVARELRIPCLLGVPAGTLAESEVVTVDADHGHLLREAVQAVSDDIRQPPARVIFDIRHLPLFRGRRSVRVTRSALVAGYLEAHGWNTPAETALDQWRRHLAQRYSIGSLTVRDDVAEG